MHSMFYIATNLTHIFTFQEYTNVSISVTKTMSITGSTVSAEDIDLDLLPIIYQYLRW